jgi:uncharacterized NAD(P)/FAD-binding protein YdhS
MTGQARNSIAIIGGGATGTLLALHLLKSQREELRIILVERRSDVGRGMAYSTLSEEHLLNVPASRMGAFADNPGHFWDWVTKNNLTQDRAPTSFFPRHVYGRYLGDLVREAQGDGSAKARLRVVHDDCVAVAPTASGVDVQLASGVSLPSHAVVLAVGHDPEAVQQFPFAVRPCVSDELVDDPDGDILVLGTGLSMIDTWLTLTAQGHRGRIVALSRRGLLPQPHRNERNPIQLDLADIPLGTEFSYFVRWFTRLIADTEAAGGNWRDVIDGVRPFNQRIWMDWPVSGRKRFLEHYKAWWDIHRHRIAPEIRARAEAAIDDGSLEPVAGRLVDVMQDNGSLVARVRRRGEREIEEMRFSRIYDCTGIVRDVAKGSSAVVRALIERGLARPDLLRVGLDVTQDCAVLAGDGKASDRIFAAGPLTRGTFFEIDAIPEIRLQCAALAKTILD